MCEPVGRSAMQIILYVSSSVKVLYVLRWKSVCKLKHKKYVNYSFYLRFSEEPALSAVIASSVQPGASIVGAHNRHFGCAVDTFQI